jgi:hypothetical protein
MTVEDGTALDLEVLLISYRNSLSTDPRDKVYGIVGMAGQYKDQKALKIDYSMSKQETYIETIRCVIEWCMDFEQGPLNVICCSLLELSDRSLPSWVPDWAPPPDGKWNPEIVSMSYFYKANGASPPDRAFEIEDGVLIVQGLKMATIDHFGAVPATSSGPSAFGTLDAKFMDELNAPKRVFYTASKLAMSKSEHMPHSCKSQSVRRKEFARTMLCNHTAPTFDSPPTVPSEKVLQEFSEEIMSFDERNNNWDAVSLGNSGPSNALLLSVVARNLRQYRFCVSSTGSFLMTPSFSKIRDIVCVLFSCDMPIVLQEKEGGYYTFVRECYADGIMYGEAIEGLLGEKNKVVEFRIH